MANAKKTDTTANAGIHADGVKVEENGNEGLPDFSKWTPLQIGFAPYWNPGKNKSFYGELVARDERDPSFVRYLVRNLKPVERCRRGPANDDAEEGQTGEEVVVKQGETFTISVYFSLADEFDMLLSYGQTAGVAVPIFVQSTKTVKTKSGKDCWQWNAVSEPSFANKLSQFRGKHQQLKNAEAGTERQLES